MTDRRVEIHAPFRRLHVVMYLVTAGLIAGPILLFGYAIADDAIAGRGVAAVLAITAAMCVTGGVVIWLAYLGSQRVAYVGDDAIVFRTWIRLGRWGRERRISLADVKGVLLPRSATMCRLRNSCERASLRGGLGWASTTSRAYSWTPPMYMPRHASHCLSGSGVAVVSGAFLTVMDYRPSASAIGT